MTAPAFDPTASRFAIVRACTRRARHLWAMPTSPGMPVPPHPCRTAIAEQRAGLLPFTIVPPERRKLFLVLPATEQNTTDTA